MIAGNLVPQDAFLTHSPEAHRVISAPLQMSTTTKDNDNRASDASEMDSEQIWSILPISKGTKVRIIDDGLWPRGLNFHSHLHILIQAL